MAKATKAELERARELLLGWLKPGDTVYTVLEHVSRSGMSRNIRIVVPYTREDGTIDHIHPNHSAAVLLGYSRAKRGDGLRVGGCGMDLGFSLVYNLASALYGRDGYACLGKGKCPSPYHVNHRDTIRCEGTRVHNPDGPDFGSYCYGPDYRHNGDKYEDWPRLPARTIKGVTIPGAYAACVELEDGTRKICPTCKGAGRLPNPDGPERFDLVHQDGYALRHRWL